MQAARQTDDDVAKDRHQQEADHGAGDHFADTCQDGEQAVAHSLNRETPYIDDCQRYVEQGVEGQELVRLMDTTVSEASTKRSGITPPNTVSTMHAAME